MGSLEHPRYMLRILLECMGCRPNVCMYVRLILRAVSEFLHGFLGLSQFTTHTILSLGK